MIPQRDSIFFEKKREDYFYWFLKKKPVRISTFRDFLKSKKFSNRISIKNTVYKKELGQGMTEYIIVVALIAVAAIGVYTLFGQTLRNQTAGLAMELAGQSASSAINNAKTSANKANKDASSRKGLDNYYDKNH